MPHLTADVIAPISQRTGIIKALTEIPFHHDDASIYSYGVLMADTSVYSLHQCSSRNGGAGLTRDQAIGAAIGESLERYCCNFYDRNEFQLGSFDDFSEQAIEPSSWALYSQRQYDTHGFLYSEFNSRARIAWVEARSLVSNKIKLVPASMVYLPYYRTRAETLISPSVSTGLACSKSGEIGAILYGIYECIERDAFSIYWLHALKGRPRIDPQAITDKELQQIFFERFARPGIRYYMWDITLDIPVATFFCVAIGASNIGQLFCVGAASHLDARQALCKALTEASQHRPYLRYQHVRDPHWQCKEDFGNVKSFDDHARVYTSRPELISQLDFCTIETKWGVMPPNDSTGDLETDLYKVLCMLDNLGFDVLVVDVTTPDIREVGFHVVRVLIPGLHPLHGDHRYPFLGGKRLYDVPLQQKLLNKRRAEDELCKLPHPFP